MRSFKSGRVCRKCRGELLIGTKMASISVISCHSHVSRPCCILAASPHVFLFNCPAGSTRHSSDHHSRIVRSTRIYISRLTEDCIGGLPGLLFCIEEARGSDSTVAIVGDAPPPLPSHTQLLLADFKCALAGPVGLKLWFACAKAVILHWLRLNVEITEVRSNSWSLPCFAGS